MPLYDFVVMVKPTVDRRGLVELMKRLGERVYSRNGVVANIKSFGRVNLAYGIKKRDGRFFEVFCRSSISGWICRSVVFVYTKIVFFCLGADTERGLASWVPS